MTQMSGVPGEPRDPETYSIIGAAMEAHRHLGPGFLEPVYQEALAMELAARGVPYEREVELPVYYKGVALGLRYRVDLICYGGILVELKGLHRLTGTEEGQIIHYLTVSRRRRGVLLNFGSHSLQFKRFVGPKDSLLKSSVKSV